MEVCATNCETCSSGAIADCSLCLSGYWAHPTTNVCETSCPIHYYENSGPRSCLACNPACATCNGPHVVNCLSCSPQYFMVVANKCDPCDSRCAECTGYLNTQCTGCAAGKFYQSLAPNTCVDSCSDIGANYYTDGSLCKGCNIYCATCSGP